MALLTWFYRRLGRRYPYAFVSFELPNAIIITIGTVALFSFYYEGDFAEYLQLGLVACALTMLGVAIVLVRTYPRLRPISRWIGGERDAESTAAAWGTAAGLPLELLRRDGLIPLLVVIIPSTIAALLILDLTWLAFFPLFAGSMIAAGYSVILHYLATETGMRPILVDINREVSPQLAPDCRALPLRTKLLAALPMINVITGLTVAALTGGGGGGGAGLGFDVLVALAVATTISLELTLMLSKSILRPLADIQRATQAVAEGSLDVHLPITTGDEIGELAASFNQMLAGLRERERIREAFGTYLDSEVAEHILSDSFNEGGESVEVSIVFVDVRDFSGFAARASAHEVVARLNELFEVAVPVVERHHGHVDKFEGDGLMAVFGSPRPDAHHAEHAVRAACEIAHRINGPEAEGSEDDGAAGPLRVGVGVNTGEVIAGSIGGGGRLNYSVIGGAVNVAARVEAATRDTSDPVLITERTASELPDEIRCDSRGKHDLKGIDGSVKLFAPQIDRDVLVPGSRDDHEADQVPTESLAGRVMRRLARGSATLDRGE